MSRLWFFLSWLSVSLASAQPRIQLSPPQLQADSVLFETAARVRLELDYPGVELRYSLDGSPVSGERSLYTAPLVIKESATVRAQAFHPDFADSPEVRLTVRSRTWDRPVAAVSVSPSPAEKYTGAGLSALTDHQKGSLNFAASPNAWLGWATDTLRLNIELADSLSANQLTLSLLDNAGAWIMVPAAVEVYASGKQVGRTVTAVPRPGMPAQHTFLEVPLKPWRFKAVEVLVLPRQLPPWHDGAGQPAWIFLDEVFLSQIPR